MNSEDESNEDEDDTQDTGNNVYSDENGDDPVPRCGASVEQGQGQPVSGLKPKSISEHKDATQSIVRIQILRIESSAAIQSMETGMNSEAMDVNMTSHAEPQQPPMEPTQTQSGQPNLAEQSGSSPAEPTTPTDGNETRDSASVTEEGDKDSAWSNY
jgi:hypothetical protein